MNEHKLCRKDLTEFAQHLQREERSPGTIAKYERDVNAFALWLGDRTVDRQAVCAWKEELLSGGRAPATVNAMLAAVNSLFRFLGWEGCRARYLKIQRRMFRDTSRELTHAEYEKLLNAARSQGREQLALLMETMCATGIRVGEVPYITLEAARAGRADVSLKGKIRTILLPGKLCRKLIKFARKNQNHEWFYILSARLPRAAAACHGRLPVQHFGSGVQEEAGHLLRRGFLILHQPDDGRVEQRADIQIQLIFFNGGRGHGAFHGFVKAVQFFQQNSG